MTRRDASNNNSGLPRPLLWVPSHYLEQTEQSLAQRRPANYLRIYLGFHDLIGATPTWSDVTERLRRYGLGQILSVLSRISVMLEHFGPWRHPEAQKRLCDGLFGPKSGQVWSAVLKWIRKHKEEEGFEVTPTLFHELQVVSLAKAAFLTLEVNTTETTASLDGLAEALLMVNDLTGSLVGAPAGPDPSTPEGFRLWHQYFVANGLFHHGDTEVHSLPRAYDLYLTDKPHLRNDPSYVDLPDLIRQATGLEPDTLWFVLFAFMAHWRTISPDSLPQVPGVMNRSSYFSNLKFTNAEVEKLFQLVCLDAKDMKTQVGNLYRLDDLKPFHVLPFAKWPLVAIGDAVFCLSLNLLKQKLTSGLHHLFLDEVKFPKKEARGRYLRYMGSVFEDYVHRLLARTYPPIAHRFLGPSELSQAVDGKSCDFVILYGDAVVLLEAKATRFSLAARTGGSWDEYKAQYNEIFTDSAEQLQNTIEAIESGKLLSLGVDPSVVHQYFPLIVTLEDLSMNRVVYRKVREDPKNAGLLVHAKVRPLQAIDVGDLEFIEIALESEMSLRQMLEEKVSHEESRDESFANYCIQRDWSFFKGPVNTYLGNQFKQLGDQALKLFRSHKSGSAADNASQ